jgi:hypothetical protein
MIRLPQRSVTRFFIPLSAVLTLLFCIVLVMPVVGNPEDAAEAAEREERLRQLNEQLDKLRQAGHVDLSDQLRAELDRLRTEKAQALKDRLALRVLEIDGATGKLYYRDPERVEIASEADALALVLRDRREHGGDRQELYYVVLFPRDRNSAYPTEAQLATYERWFAGVALAFDVPGGQAEKAKRP